jgi:hypothetical protein
VARLSLKAQGTGARSGLWLWVSPTEYVLFSQDTEKGHWSYNADGRRGTGTELLKDETGGKRAMRLVHDGDSVQILLDDKELADVPVRWSEGIRVGISGQARMAGDSLEAEFGGVTASMVDG